ncbi:hypothetical protein GF359_02015 [candidate division WOR-3 bacterium]|uniref:Uncharacterized protein n=1 Tax=candidate division WOR-3 bacterium TaxID=2052148 RepID=A0A9D5K9A1_UNCW3|nr:hypothetical protein [candidate division WOR-3 bacterium]MBD3363970.1 hypothetical protein [candidate division WOR-3 bacterium]
MWIYCLNNIEIECEGMEKWDVNPSFLLLKNCNIKKKISSKEGIPQIILNSNQIIAIGKEKLDWHELQRIR